MNLVVFDLETSGFDPEKNDIIQIGAIAVNGNFDELARFEVKVDFNVKNAEPEALEINHFTIDAWRDAVSPEEAINQFINFCKPYKDVKKVSKKGWAYDVTLLAGHNSEGFDRDFLFKWSKRIMPKKFLPFDWFTLDSMQLRNALDICHALKFEENFTRKSLKLVDLIDFEGAHDALADVEATVKLLKALTKSVNQHMI